MMVKDFSVPAARSAVAGLAAALSLGLLVGFAPAASAQPQLIPAPPTFATTRSNASMSAAAGATATRYSDMGSDKNLGFVLEQRGTQVLLQDDGSKDILTLMPIPGQRGDTFFMDYTGRTVLKVTQQNNVISYLRDKNGAPAEPVARVAALSAGPNMVASLEARRLQAIADLTKMAGHEVTIFGTQSFGSNEAWAHDALNILVLGVKNANGMGGRSASKLEKVTLTPAKTPKVTFKDGELKIEVNPAEGWSGRITPEAITSALTAARSAG